MVIKLIDTEGDAIYVDPSLVAVIAPAYDGQEKTNGSMIHVRTGLNCMHLGINEKPEQVAYLINNAKADGAKTVTLRRLTKKDEGDEE